MKIKVSKHKLNIHYRGSPWGSRTQQHAYCLRYAHSHHIESHLGKKQPQAKIPIAFLFGQLHFNNVTSHALFYGSHLVMRSKRCVVQNQGIIITEQFLAHWLVLEAKAMVEKRVWTMKILSWWLNLFYSFLCDFPIFLEKWFTCLITPNQNTFKTSFSDYMEPYVIGLLPRYVEIRTISPRALIQSIELSKPRYITQGKHMYVASTSHVWRLIPVSIPMQIQQLLQDKQFSLALTLAVSKQCFLNYVLSLS